MDLNHCIFDNYHANSQFLNPSINSILKFLEEDGTVTDQDLKVLQYAFNLFHVTQKNKILLTESIYDRMKASVENEHHLKKHHECFIEIRNIILSKPSIILPLIIKTDERDEDEAGWILLNETSNKSNNVRLFDTSPLKQDNANTHYTGKVLTPKEADFQDTVIETNLGEFLACGNKNDPEEDLQTLNELNLKEKQQLIIAQFGNGLFTDYLPDWILCLKKSVFDLLGEHYFQSQIRHVLESHAPKQQQIPKTLSPQPQSRLLNIVLITQTKFCIESCIVIIQEILKNPELRSEFPSLILQALPQHIPQDLGPKVYPLIEFFIKNYLPEILEATLKKFSDIFQDPIQSKNLEQHLSLFFGGQHKDREVNIFELAAYLILNHILEPTEAGFEVFIAKMRDEKLSMELKKLLNTALIDLFFLEPSPLNSRHKKLVVNILKSIHGFFSAFNKAKSTYKNFKMNSSNPELDYGKMLLQHMSSLGLLPLEHDKEGINYLDLNIRALIEKILWKWLNPESTSEKTPSLTMKLMVTIISAYCQKLGCKLCSGSTLKILVNRIINDPLQMENPFDRDMPPDAFFGQDDKEFSTQIDLNIKEIIKEFLKLCSSNNLIKKMSNKAVKLIPEIGQLIEQKLNKICNSSNSVLPLLIAIQFLYKLDSKCASPGLKTVNGKEGDKLKKAIAQRLFFEALDHDRHPLLVHVFCEDKGVEKKTEADVDEKVLGKNTKDLEKLLEGIIPLGLRNYALSCFQGLYKIFKEDLILKELGIYILNGLNITLSEETKEKTKEK